MGIDLVGARDAARAAADAFTEDTETYWGPTSEELRIAMLAELDKARAMLTPPPATHQELCPRGCGNLVTIVPGSVTYQCDHCWDDIFGN